MPLAALMSSDRMESDAEAPKNQSHGQCSATLSSCAPISRAATVSLPNPDPHPCPSPSSPHSSSSSSATSQVPSVSVPVSSASSLHSSRVSAHSATHTSTTHAIPSCLRCVLCCHVFAAPLILYPCAHSFCSECIASWRQAGHNTCPLSLCGKPFQHTMPSLVAASMVEELGKPEGKTCFLPFSFPQACLRVSAFLSIATSQQFPSNAHHFVQQFDHLC